MESVVSRSAPWQSETLRRVDHDAVRTWALVGTVVLYLAINGGGYDLDRAQPGGDRRLVDCAHRGGLGPVAGRSLDAYGLDRRRSAGWVRRLDRAVRHLV